MSALGWRGEQDEVRVYECELRSVHVWRRGLDDPAGEAGGRGEGWKGCFHFSHAIVRAFYSMNMFLCYVVTFKQEKGKIKFLTWWQESNLTGPRTMPTV